jgi:hypothetical protein
MSFSEITAVDLVVNQIVTIVTKYSPSSPAGVNTTGDVVPAEIIVRTSSNVGLNQINTRPELSNTVQVYNPLYSFGNQTFNYSNSPLPDIKSQLSITQPVDLGNRPFGFNIIGNTTPVVDTGASYGRQPFLIYNTLSTVSSIDPALELTNNNIGGLAVVAGAGLANGSVLLNGTTQSLTANTAATWTYLHNGLQDYTIECWYRSSASTYQNLLGTSGTTASIGFELSINNPTVGAVTVVYTRGVSSNNTWTYANSAVATSGWYHVATTFASSTKRSNIYVNGNLAGTAANVAFAYSASAPTNTLGIGFTTGTGQFNGQITNVRITKSIVYTANFLPTIPLTNISNTQLLLQFNSVGALLTDSSTNNNTITNVGTATYSTVVPPLTSNVATVNNYYNYSQLYFNGGLNIPYGDITSNVLASSSPVNTYTNPTGAMLNANASILTTGTVDRVGRFDQSNVTVISVNLQPGSVSTQAGSQVLLADLSQDIRSNHISGYIAQYAVGVPFLYYDLVSTTNTTDYSQSTVLNQSVNFEFAKQTVSVQRYFVPRSATVNSVTNNQSPQQTIIINAQPEFMLVNSDKLFVASNVNPTNYQTIQPVTPDNDPRLASLKVGFAVKGQTGTNPYNPQNIY